MMRGLQLAEFEAFWEALPSSKPAKKCSAGKSLILKEGFFLVTGASLIMQVFLVPQKVIKMLSKSSRQIVLTGTR